MITSESFINTVEPYLKPESGHFEDARPSLVQLIRPYEHESWRGHHNLIHLSDMAEYLMSIAHELEDPATVFGAMLGHDSNYEPWLWNVKGANEELSRARSDYFLLPHYSPQRVLKIGHYIMATIEHPNDSKDSDQADFLDADMSVTGAPEERNQQYADGVMEEYVVWGGVPEKVFREKRINFLKGLDNKRVFITERAQDLYEAQAHRNFGAEILRHEVALKRL